MKNNFKKIDEPEEELKAPEHLKHNVKATIDTLQNLGAIIDLYLGKLGSFFTSALAGGEEEETAQKKTAGEEDKDKKNK